MTRFNPFVSVPFSVRIFSPEASWIVISIGLFFGFSSPAAPSSGSSFFSGALTGSFSQ